MNFGADAGRRTKNLQKVAAFAESARPAMADDSRGLDGDTLTNSD